MSRIMVEEEFWIRMVAENNRYKAALLEIASIRNGIFVYGSAGEIAMDALKIKTGEKK